MAHNEYRGEITAILDGTEHRLVLTLGALAELESELGAESLAEFADRLSRGGLSARDLIAIIGAGLRGAGADMTDEDVGAMQTPGGIAGFSKIAADLFRAAFSGGPPGGKTGRDLKKKA